MSLITDFIKIFNKVNDFLMQHMPVQLQRLQREIHQAPRRHSLTRPTLQPKHHTHRLAALV
jgi:hypothetical protein